MRLIKLIKNHLSRRLILVLLVKQQMFYKNWKLADQGLKNILLNEMSYKFQERMLGKRPRLRLKILVIIQKLTLKQKGIIGYIRVKKF